MKLGKLYFDGGPLGISGGVFTSRMLHPAESSPTSTFVIFELPKDTLAIPFVTRTGSLEVTDTSAMLPPPPHIYWNTGLWMAKEEDFANIDAGKYLTVNPSPAIALQKLVRFAQKEWAPIGRAFEHKTIPFDRLLEVWAKYPDIFYTFIARHRAPSLLDRQNFYTIMRWDEWNRGRKRMQERVDEMIRQNLGGGKLTAANLSKRARDIGLA
jgi:hypothetical protein